MRVIGVVAAELILGCNLFPNPGPSSARTGFTNAEVLKC
jgi:hypothetical protein